MATFYVNTDSTAGGDGTTNATSGANRAYATLDEAVDARWTGTPSTPIEIECSAPSGVADTARVTITDVASTSSNYLRIYPASGHRAGTQWSASKYRLVVNAGFNAAIAVQDEFVRIEGLQVEQQAALANSASGIFVTRKASGDQRVIGCFVRLTGDTTTPADFSDCIGADQNNAFLLTIVNNICVGGKVGIRSYYGDASGVNVIYNNLCIAQTDYGIRASSGFSVVSHVKNNATQGSPTAGYSDSEVAVSTWTSATNLSEDTTSPQSGLRSLAISFVNEAGGDYALASGDTAAKDAGTSLAADGQYAFSTDINGTSRSGTWDIGPHEFVSGGGGGSVAAVVHHLRQQGIQ